MISIVLTAYNGRKYITDLMDSLRNQTVAPDEVLVLDDGSTDGTDSVVENYIASHQLEGWKLIRNQENLGWKKNFFKGIKMAKGDLIFPCDQDDIWCRDKLEIMGRIMREQRQIELLVSNYYLKQDEKDGYAATSNYDDYAVQKVPFDHQWALVRRPGCVFCFRKSFFDDIESEWDVQAGHDANLWRFAVVRGTLYSIHYSSVFFRRHGDNTTAGNNRGQSGAKRLEMLKEEEERIQKFKKYAADGHFEADPEEFDRELSFTRLRIELIEHKSPKAFFTLLFRYKKYFPTRLSLLGDVKAALRKGS